MHANYSPRNNWKTVRLLLVLHGLSDFGLRNFTHVSLNLPTIKHYIIKARCRALRHTMSGLHNEPLTESELFPKLKEVLCIKEEAK